MKIHPCYNPISYEKPSSKLLIQLYNILNGFHHVDLKPSLYSVKFCFL
jgi:hypothetical protein